jgi:hypothetical protein
LAAAGNKRFRARDHEDGFGCLGGRHLALKLVDRDEFLTAAGPQAAVFGKSLVLDDDGGDAGRGVARHQIRDVHRIAIPGIEIRDHGRVLHLADRAHHFQMRVHRKNVRIRHRVRRRELEAAAPDRIKTRRSGEFCGQRIVCRHGQCRTTHIELGA